MLRSEAAPKSFVIEPPEHVAHPWRRIIARVIDSVLVNFVGLFIASAFITVNGIIPMDQIESANSISNQIALQTSCSTLIEPGCGALSIQTEIRLYSYIFVALISLCYFIITTKLVPNATLGKFLMRLQVVSTRGQDITWMQSIMRHVPWLLLDILMVVIYLYSLDTGQIVAQAEFIKILFYTLLIIQMNLTEWSQGIHDMISATAVVSTLHSKRSK